MKIATYEALAAMPLLRKYEKAFFQATKVSLKLLPPDEQRRRAILRQSENPFCALVASTPVGCAACLETQRRIEKSTARELSPQQIYCFAGLTDIAVPVIMDGQHVATLLSGQIFRRKPLAGDFEMLLKKIGGAKDKAWIAKARKAFFNTPVIPKSSFQGVIQLLTMFAQQLPEDARRHLMMARPDHEPKAVSSAKAFIESQSGGPLTLDALLQHVRVSRFHFCKIFKKSTGITFTEYMAHNRVMKAKTLLLDPALRVSEVVFAAGFGSIPQFNSVFKRFVGMSPTEYRYWQREKLKELADSAPDGLTVCDPDSPAESEAALPSNIIRPSPFRQEETSLENILHPQLNERPRRAARA